MSSPTQSGPRPASRTALLLLGCLAIASSPFVEAVPMIPSQQYEDAENDAPLDNSIPLPSHALQFQAQTTPPEAQQPAGQLRRRLAAPRPDLDEEGLQKQMRSFLGGLFPPVDSQMLPVYLNNVDAPEKFALDMYNPSGESKLKAQDLVFFWHIPKASGSTVKNIMNYCFGMRRAEKLEEEPTMAYVRDNIVNMDTSTPDGLSFSFANQLVNSGMVDVVVSNYFLSGAALFTDEHHGKAFTIMRHPVDLALSLFHYRRTATWERSYRADWAKMSFYDYVSSDYYMDSWMVRQLTGTMPWVELTENHLERAKLVVARKLFVGIITEMDETFRQLKEHYHWEEKEPFCAHNFLHDSPTNSNKHPKLQGGRGGKTWNLVVDKEKWDVSLYHFALEIFAAQRERYPPPQSQMGEPAEGEAPPPPQEGEAPPPAQEGEAPAGEAPAE